MNRVARWIGIFLLCTAPLALFGIIQHKKQQQEDRAFAWAEKYIEYVRLLPTRQQKVCNCYALSDGSDAFERIEQRFGVSARSCADLGELHFLQGNYATAHKFFKQALQLSPKNETAQQRMAYLEECNRVRWAVASQLPKGHVVTAIAPVTIKNKTFWALVFGQSGNNPEGEKLGYANFNGFKIKSNDLYLTIFTGTGQKWHKIQTIKLEDSKQSQKWLHPYHQIFVQDLTGDYQPELIFIEMDSDSGGDRDYVQVFIWQNEKFSRVYDLPHQLRTWFEDLNHDGKYEIGSTCEIGSELSHGAMPRWPSIYAYKNGRYVLANNDFPQEFKNWPHELRALLQTHPTDYDLWHHLGQAYETKEQFTAALKAYQRAESY